MTQAAVRLGTYGQATSAMPVIPTLPHQTCAVRMIDRRTAPPRVNDRPLVVFTKTPHAAAAELLAGRDAAIWETHIERMAADTRKIEGRI